MKNFQQHKAKRWQLGGQLAGTLAKATKRLSAFPLTRWRGGVAISALVFLFTVQIAVGAQVTGLREASPRRAARPTIISECDAVRAIVGEAAGQPYIVKLGVAEAIHNRGSLNGVYGLNAAHNRTEPAWVWRDGRRAWEQSKSTSITHGATHFGNRSDVMKGTFAGLQFTCQIGTGKDATYFFKVRAALANS
jgi:hypothetical protein